MYYKWSEKDCLINIKYKMSMFNLSNQNFKSLITIMFMESMKKTDIGSIKQKIPSSIDVSKKIFDNKIFENSDFDKIYKRHYFYEINAKKISIYLRLTKNISSESDLMDTHYFKKIFIKYSGMNYHSSYLGNTVGIPILKEAKILIPDIKQEKEIRKLFHKTTKNVYSGYSTNNIIEILKNYKTRVVYNGQKDKNYYVKYCDLKDYLDIYYKSIIEKVIKKNKLAKKYVVIIDGSDTLIFEKEQVEEHVNEMFNILFGKELIEFKKHQSVAKSISKIKIDNKMINSLKIKVDLFEHQKTAVTWLNGLYKNKITGAILADDMGLGKTLSGIAFAISIKAKTILVVCPASVISVWEKEIKEFAPELMKKVTILSYEKFIKTNIKNTDLLIVDEAQRAKNKNIINNSLSHVKSKFSLLLSGTPIENKVQDIYNILSTIDPTYTKIYNMLCRITKDEIKLAHETKEIIKGIYLRREKTSKELPSNLHINEVLIKMNKQETEVHKKIIDFYGNKLIKKHSKTDLSYYNDAIIALMRLRQTTSYYGQLKDLEYLKNIKFTQETSKEKKMMKLINKSSDTSDKWIIFTEFKETVINLKKSLPSALVITGDVPSNKRGNIIKQFQEDPESKYMIISLKAGNAGITLHAANNIIVYDLWWNPAIIQQAIARAYRIGQKRDVNVFMFANKDSIDENVLNIINLKQEIIDNFTSNKKDKKSDDMNNTDKLIGKLFKK